MGRTYQDAASLRLPDPLRMVSRLPVLGGSAAKGGHELDAGEIRNFLIAQARAGATASWGWADGQNLTTSVLALERGRVRIPRLSSRHDDVRLVVRANATAGTVTFAEAATPATFVSTPAIGADAFYQTPALSLAGKWTADADGDFADVSIFASGTDVQLDDVMVKIDGLDVGGAWPAGDGTLAEGVVDGAVVFDTDEAAGGEHARPGSARLARQTRQTIQAIERRVRGFTAWSGIIGATGATAHQWLTPYVHRATIPVLAETRSKARRAVLWLRGYNNDVEDFDVRVHHGPGEKAAYLEPHRPHVTRVVFAAGSGWSWKKVLVTVPESRDYAHDYPGAVPGFTNFNLYTSQGDADAGLAAYSGWTV